MPPNHALSSFLLHPPFTLPEELRFNIKVLLEYKTAQCTQLKLNKQTNNNPPPLKKPNKQKQDDLGHHSEDSQVGPTFNNNLQSYN